MQELRIAHVSTFTPTQCGIATYTEDLIASLQRTTALKIRLSYDDSQRGEFDQTIPIQNATAYDEAVDYINDSRADVVSLQHEFAIFGGDRGSYVLKLVHTIKKPIVTTLHTVKTNMSEHKRRILSQVAAASARLIVLTSESKAFVTRNFGIAESKVVVIPHGIPTVPFTMPQCSELRRSLNTPMLFVSAGHRRRTKGFHLGIEALARYRVVNPNFKYVIIGTHQSQFHGPPSYRQELLELADNMGLKKQVSWIDSYLPKKEFIEYVKAADVGLVTYTCEEQNASGILPLFLGCGRVVVATNFECARSMQNEASGLFLSESNMPDDIAKMLGVITDGRFDRYRLMATTYAETRPWLWSEAARHYRSAFEDAIGSCSSAKNHPSARKVLASRSLVTAQ